MAEETPTAALEDRVVKLRKQSADRFEEQLNGHFWLKQCNQHSPLCAGYRLHAHELYVGSPVLLPRRPARCRGRECRREAVAPPQQAIACAPRHPTPALMMNALERWSRAI